MRYDSLLNQYESCFLYLTEGEISVVNTLTPTLDWNLKFLSFIILLLCIVNPSVLCFVLKTTFVTQKASIILSPLSRSNQHIQMFMELLSPSAPLFINAFQPFIKMCSWQFKWFHTEQKMTALCIVFQKWSTLFFTLHNSIIFLSFAQKLLPFSTAWFECLRIFTYTYVTFSHHLYSLSRL